MDNLELWNAVEKTDPSHTKEVNFGRKITAIDPYRQVQNATKQFGPAGIGWGWKVSNVQHLPTNELGILIRLWHGKPDNYIEHWGQASLYIDKLEKKKDPDCFKKATTDGITKCLSYLGFNADIFLGKYEDNKYVQSMAEEFKPPEYSAIQKAEFDEILKTEDALGFVVFSKTVGNDVMIALNNSFVDGQKSSGKAKMKQMDLAGWKILKQCAEELGRFIIQQDELGIAEIIDDMSSVEKRLLSGLLTQEQINYLKERAELS